MKKERTLLRFASILLFIKNLIFILAGFSSTYFIIIGIVLEILPIYIFSVSFKTENEIIKNKKLYIITAILCIVYDILVAVLLFICNDNISSLVKENKASNPPNIKKEDERPKEKISNEAKKIDILMKFGVLLIVLAGIIFATSNTQTNNVLLKPVLIFTLSMLFCGLSYFFRNKIVIKSSEKIYYILFCVFMVCFSISLGYFKVFGSNFSFIGSEKYLMFMIVTLTTSVCTINIFKKYKYNYLKEISVALLYLSFLLLLLHFNLENISIIFILNLITLIIYYFKDKFDNSISIINDSVFYLNISYYICAYTFLGKFDIFQLVVGIFILLTLIFRLKNDNNKNKIVKIIYPIYLSVFIFLSLNLASESCNIDSASSLFITTSIFNYNLLSIIIMLFLNYFFSKSKDSEIMFSGFYSSLVFILISNMNLIIGELYSLAIIVDVILLVYSIIMTRLNKNQYIKLSLFISEIVSLILFSISFVNTYELFEGAYILISLILIGVLSLFEKKLFEEYKLKEITYYVIIIGCLFISSISASEYTNAFNILVLILMVVYRYLYKVNEKYLFAINLTYIISIFLHSYQMFITYTSVTISCIILLFSLIVCIIFSRKYQRTCALTILLAYIPYALIINELNILNELKTMLYILPLLLLVFIITRKILGYNKKNNFIIEIILLSIIFIAYIFEINELLGFFTGIISLIMIFIGFKFEKYNSLFYTGLGVFILNLIVQLSEFWSKVPLFVYLLIIGLGIIGYVTYKEIKKVNNKENINKKKEIKEEKNTIEPMVNVISIIVIIFIIISFILCLSFKEKYEIINTKDNFIAELKQNGIDVDKIYIEENDKGYRRYIYIEKGYHFDLEKYKKIYNKYYIKNGYYDYLDVNWYSPSCMKQIKKKGYCNNNDDYNKNDYENYENPVENKSMIVNGVEITVTNDIINFLDFDVLERSNGSYYYYSNGYGYYSNDSRFIPKGTITYNTNDVDSININIKNPEGKYIKITSFGNETIYTNGENENYNLKVGDGYIYIDVSDTDIISNNSSFEIN